MTRQYLFDETEDAAEQYGYGDAAPDTNLLTKAFPKRLSTREISIQRRSSSCTMCHPRSFSFSSSEHHGNYGDYKNLSVTPHKNRPRRSSIEGGSCPQRTRSRARRRASIAACITTTTTTVPGRRRASFKRRSSLKSLASVTMLALVALPQCATATAAPQMLQSTRAAAPSTSMTSTDPMLRGLPSMAPSTAPSEMPTFADTGVPSETPSESPTFNPTFTPTVYPSEVLSSKSFSRTAEPTTMEPTNTPSEVPTFANTVFPARRPPRTQTTTTTPTFAPTVADTDFPSEAPTFNPTFTLTVYPLDGHSSQPISRTAEPTTMDPSNTPSETPTFADTDFPTRRPPRTQTPTMSPSVAPTSEVVVCMDSKELRHNKKKKKDCGWVGKKKVGKRCNKKWGDKGKKLYDACPLTCLPKGLGSCVDL